MHCLPFFSHTKRNLFTSLFVSLLLSVTVHAQQVIQLYSGKPAGSENWNWQEGDNNKNMFNTRVVYNVVQPTLTAYLPDAAIANGTAVIIAPGGAFHTLSIESEGIDVAKWLNAKGIAAFVLKYRLVHSVTDDPVSELMKKMGDFKKLDEENDSVVTMAIADGLKAIEFVRTHATDYKIDPRRIGFMGFSAGGTVTMGTVFNSTAVTRPDFAAPIYSYMNALKNQTIPTDAPPLFICAATDDQLGLASHSSNLYNAWIGAKKLAELHMYEKGGHGFGMRKQNIPTDNWIERFYDWLKTMNLVTAPAASANPFQRIPTPNDTLKAVRILADNKVVLSIYAPEAKEVTVMGDYAKVYGADKLTKADNGVWSVTIGPLAPDIYTYDFTVDGVRTFDPKNPQYKEGQNNLSNVFELPGKENDFQSVKNVPHGKVETVWFASSVMNNTGRMHVYTPPGYEKMKSKLPVLYLQHGGGDNDASWTTAGKANFILDNLLAEGKIKPMVVVMAMGHPAEGFFMQPDTDGDPFYKQFFTDIVPYIESHYNVSNKKEDRAFCGLSMGGIQALNMAIYHADKFGYVLPLSTGYFPDQLKTLEEKHVDALKNPEINKLKLFWIAMGGEKDIAYQNGVNVNKLFDKYGIKYQTNTYPAGHTFITWRHNLYEFAPLLFK